MITQHPSFPTSSSDSFLYGDVALLVGLARAGRGRGEASGEEGDFGRLDGVRGVVEVDGVDGVR